MSKRERLVSAARDLLYRQGAAQTTLAEIAAAADVPIGNVYYYFKTKDDLIAAVVRELTTGIESTLDELTRRHRSPRARLKALIRELAGRTEETAQYGCPFGTLSAELSKRAAGSDLLSAPLLRIQLDWAEQQFRALGRRDATDLAVELIASYQGSAVLTSALGRPDLLARHARRLERWIDTTLG